jgi:hypothetical protein
MLPQLMMGSPHFDFLIAEFSDDNPFLMEIWTSIAARQTEAYIELHKEQLKPLITVVHSEAATDNLPSYQRWKILAEQRAKFADAGIATYLSMDEAAKALRRFIDYCRAKSVK